MKLPLLIISLFFSFYLSIITETHAQTTKATISGVIKDKDTGELLTGATCYISDLKTGDVSNQYGFYSLTLPKGKHKIIYAFIGYKTQERTVNLTKNEQLNIYLEITSNQIDAIEINGINNRQNIQSTTMSTARLPVKLLQKLPSFMGETDVLKSITLLPGIQNGGEGSSGLYVRGGGPDENLLILDEAPVYNASHLMGFFSVFNSDIIKNIEIYKGGIPARYGGKISSVIDLTMKDGNNQHFRLNGGIGNLSSRLTLQGPLIKNKWSYLISGRRTYADVLGKLMGIEVLSDNKLYFYDLNLKTTLELNNKNRLFASSYSGKDEFKYGEDIYMNWGNTTFTLRWNHIFGEKLFSNTSFLYSQYRYNLGIGGSGADQFDWKSNINDYNLKYDLGWYINSRNHLKFGLNVIKHHFNPGQISAGENSYYSDLQLTNYNALDGAIYFSNDQTINRSFAINYGLRISGFQQIGPGSVREYKNPDSPNEDELISEKSYHTGYLIGDPYWNFEPRLSVRYSLSSNSSIKTSYNRMAQNLHLISNSASPTPLDLWLPSSKYIKPLTANQIAVGYFKNLKQNLLESSIELYYKKMKNVIDYKNGADLFLNEDIETELLRGKGYSYGLEFSLKKQEGRTTGWISYTLSRSMRKIPGINEGKAYLSSNDHTHDISIVTNHKINNRITISCTWVYSTGKPTTYPIAKYEIQGNPVFYYGERNSSRIPDYHRLDLALTLNSRKNTYRKLQTSWNFGLYNVYARKNAFSVTYKRNEDNPNISEAHRLSIIGTIIPSVTYNLNF